MHVARLLACCWTAELSIITLSISVANRFHHHVHCTVQLHLEEDYIPLSFCYNRRQKIQHFLCSSSLALCQNYIYSHFVFNVFWWLCSSLNAWLTQYLQGSGGGPLESNTTAFLVRSLNKGPEKGSILAVDAGVHLSAIVKILKNNLPDIDRADAQGMFTVPGGPFAGLKSPFKSAKAIAAYITSELISTYLITHPHMDHIAGFVINTAAIQGPARTKRLAGLPSTIDAFKNHIFNNVIWPNLTDEGGANLVTYTRLIEGGSVAMGEGDSKGYQEISEGLSVKTWAISHGNCANIHQHRGDGHRFVGSISGSISTHGEILSPGFKSQIDVRRQMSGPVSHSRERQHDYFSLTQVRFCLDSNFPANSRLRAVGITHLTGL